MNEINNFNQIAFRSYSAPVQQNTVTNPITAPAKAEQAQDFYIDQKGAEALRANIVISNPIDITKPISVSDYETKLQKAGMVKGQDYDIMPHQNGGQSVYIIDKEGNPIKSAIWTCGTGADCYDGCTNISYPNTDGISAVSTTYDRNNVMETRETRYKDIEGHKNLFPEYIDMNTTADDYAKILKEKNIDFDIERQGDNQMQNVLIIEKDSNGVMNKMTTFNDFGDGARMIGQSNSPDKNGNLVHDISLISDGPYSELVVSDYLK